MQHYDFIHKLKVAVDIESYDPLLRSHGSGVYRKDGHVIGVALSDGNVSEFYAIDHKDLDPIAKEKNIEYLKIQLRANNEKIFANGIYDLDWLVNGLGWQVNGKLNDVQIAEPLLNEYKTTYNLESLAQEYLGVGKLTNFLTEKYGSQVIEHLAEIPLMDVSRYGSEDTRLTYKIFEKQLVQLQKENLLEIYDLETRLIRPLLLMRKTGVRMDERKLNKTGMFLSDVRYDLQQKLNRSSGFSVNVNSSHDLEKLFKRNNIPVIYGEPTDLMKKKGQTKGNPKFDKNILKTYNHPIIQDIKELKHIRSLMEKFILAYPEYLVNGRLHCNFHQLRSDSYGTVSGRLSSSNPNLQQVSGQEEDEKIESVKSEILNGQIVRKLFVPEEDHFWAKLDWSQIEYRILAHYAIGPGADKIRQEYNGNPLLDYHVKMQELSGIDDRKIVKTFNFGKAYGMGIDKMALKYGWPIEEAREMDKKYYKAVPFVKETMNRVGLKAKRVGFIKTILRRKARLPASNKAYVMLNRLIQGSAADLMKLAMVESYENGLFEVLPLHLIVHDEFDVSCPYTKIGIEALSELKYTMEHCLKFKVPIRSELEVSPSSWGELEKIKQLNKLEEFICQRKVI